MSKRRKIIHKTQKKKKRSLHPLHKIIIGVFSVIFVLLFILGAATFSQSDAKNTVAHTVSCYGSYGICWPSMSGKANCNSGWAKDNGYKNHVSAADIQCAGADSHFVPGSSTYTSYYCCARPTPTPTDCRKIGGTCQKEVCPKGKHTVNGSCGKVADIVCCK